MGALGLLISCVGIDKITGVPRLTFGNPYLSGGFQLIPVLIGLFAIAELLNKVEHRDFKVSNVAKFSKEKLERTEKKRCALTIGKSSLIGTFIGAVPGTGAAIASFISYGEAKRVSKHPEEFGSGSIEGIAASEAGNNGVTGATLIPLLTLGIPGDAVTAILMGLIVVNVAMYLEGKFLLKLFVKITKLPMNLMIPMIVLLCVTGAYAVNNAFFDVAAMMAFGIIGYVLTRMKFPVTPMLMAIILGPTAEEGMRQSLILSDGSYSIFVQRPICLLFLVISVISIIWPVIKFLLFKKEKSK